MWPWLLPLKTVVKMKNNSLDSKVFSFTDSSGAVGGCKGHTGSCIENNYRQPVTYGGPIVNFRRDQMGNMQFKLLSVREIVPSTATNTAYTCAGYNHNGVIPAGSSYRLGYYVSYNPDLTVIGDIIG